MEVLFKVILGLHITSGSIALIAGFIPMVAKKGRKLHKGSGRIYFWSMMGVVASALYLALYHWNPFLLIIAVFSFYLTIKGFIGLRMKNERLHSNARFLGIVALVTFLFSLLLFITGGYDFAQSSIRLQVLPLFFGIAGMATSAGDIKLLLIKPKELAVLAKIRSHISGMVGAYIATVTAFIVANSFIEPAIIGWIAPTVIGSIFITWQITIWTKKLGGSKASSKPKTIEDKETGEELIMAVPLDAQ